MQATTALRRLGWEPLRFLGLMILIQWTAGVLLKAADDDVSFAGIYRDERVAVELIGPISASGRAEYKGTVQLGEEKFPLNAYAEENRLKGTFESRGDKFEFTGTVVGRIFSFTTEGTSYKLTKQTLNPLARAPAKANPLALSRTNALASTNTAPASATFRTGTSKYRRHPVMDDPNMIGGEAFSLIIPSDWQVEGGLAWRMHPASPAYVEVRVGNPNGFELLEAFPALPFVWLDGGIPLFPVGSKYRGNEVHEPIEDPVAYIKQIIVPRFRQNIGPAEVLEVEEIPTVAAAVAEAAKEPGVEKKFRAARLRLEYVINGKFVHEDIFCVLGSARLPALRTTFWGPDRNYSFRAERGQLAPMSRVFQSIVNSYRPTLPWFNRYSQLLANLARSQVDSTRPVAELTRYLAGTTNDLEEGRRAIYEKQIAVQEGISSVFSQYVRGLSGFRDPFDGRKVEFPSAFTQVWANSKGEYLLSDSSGFDPNRGANSGWQAMPAYR